MSESQSPSTINQQILNHYGWRLDIPTQRQRKAILLDTCFMTFINNNFIAIQANRAKEEDFLSYLVTIFKDADVFIDSIVLEETYDNCLKAPHPFEKYKLLYSKLYELLNAAASTVNYVTLPLVAKQLSDYRYGNEITINSIVSSIANELYPEFIVKSDVGKPVELIYRKLISSSKKNTGDRTIQITAHLLSLYGYREVIIYTNDKGLRNTYSQGLRNDLILQLHSCNTEKFLKKINVISYDVLLIQSIKNTLTSEKEILSVLDCCRNKPSKHISYLLESESSDVFSLNESMANEILASRILETNIRFIF